MSKLRRYKKVDTSLSHLCTFAPVKDPAVVIGSYYCKNICPHCRGTLNILGVIFPKQPDFLINLCYNVCFYLLE